LGIDCLHIFGNRVTNYIGAKFKYMQNLKKKSEKHGLALTQLFWQVDAAYYFYAHVHAYSPSAILTTDEE